MRGALAVWCAVAGFVAGSAQAADECSAKCVRPKLDKRYVVINATNGRVLEGSTRFGQADELQVVLQKNPFKYSYRIGVTAQPLDHGIAAAFLGLIPGFSSILDSAAGIAARAPSVVKAGAQPPACQGLDFPLMEDKSAAKLTEEGAAIKAELKKYEGANTFIQATDTDEIADEDVCRLCADAMKLHAEMGSLPDSSKLAERAAKFATEVEAIRQRIDELKKTMTPACLAALPQADATKYKATTALPEDATTYPDLAKKVHDNKAGYEQLAKILKNALSASQPFWEVRYPHTAGEPTEVTINITTKNLRAADAQAVAIDPVRLTIGESVLKLAAGIGFSTINDVSIIRQPSPGENDTIVNRFGYEHKSPFKPSAVVVLNAPLCDFGRLMSAGWSAGLVVSERGNNAQVEYMGGGFVGFLRNRVFLNLGFHTARVQKLAGGFKMGDIVPSSLPDPLPLEKNWSYGAMLALTYRIR